MSVVWSLPLRSIVTFDVRRWKEGPKYLGRTVHAVEVTRHPDGHKTYKVGPLRSSIGGERIFDEKIYWCPIIRGEIEKTPISNRIRGIDNDRCATGDFMTRL